MQSPLPFVQLDVLAQHFIEYVRWAETACGFPFR